jgi:hypothetical protein
MGNKEGNDSVPFLIFFCLGKGKVIRLLLPKTLLLILNKRKFNWVTAMFLIERMLKNRRL